MTRIRRSTLAALAAPLTLALAACGSNGGGDGAPPVGEPIAHVAAPEGQSWVDVASETPEGGIVVGNPDAPLKLVEYASHTCHVCAAFSQDGAAKLDEYVASGVVSYELRNYLFNSLDLTIALLARCGGPGTFHALANQGWAQFDPLMAQIQSAGPALEQAAQAPEGQRFQAIAQASGLLDFFAARGISRDQAMTCLADTAKANDLAQKSQQQAEELAISGTPTFYLNDAPLGVTSWAAVEPLLQQAGAR